MHFRLTLVCSENQFFAFPAALSLEEIYGRFLSCLPLSKIKTHLGGLKTHLL
ncbi:protein of unknown function [Legionella micdadei]|uniref:Uncharacterized protein n=1 Tax=Legionella micdadei TaxID=451 RepID=A0A098GLB1_LEGMI|nr:protein of unknown function [Legionella micdadei]